MFYQCVVLVWNPADKTYSRLRRLTLRRTSYREALLQHLPVRRKTPLCVCFHIKPVFLPIDTQWPCWCFIPESYCTSLVVTNGETKIVYRKTVKLDSAMRRTGYEKQKQLQVSKPDKWFTLLRSTNLNIHNRGKTLRFAGGRSYARSQGIRSHNVNEWMKRT